MKFKERDLVRSICRDSFASFMQEFWPVVDPKPLHWTWYLQYICDELQVASERVFRNEPRLYDGITNQSTGTGKSMTHSVMWPAWIWTRMPHAKFAGASYADDLAISLAQKCRDVVQSEKYRACFPEVVIRDDQNAKSRFQTTAGGMRYATGSKGTIQGLHFDFVALDDPIDPNRTVSPAEVAAINYWIANTISGRKTDKQVTLTWLVMQRLHQNDPTAVMAQRQRVKWIRIPATTEGVIRPPELAAHYVDGLMDPVRLPRETLDEERRSEALGAEGFAAQYLQDPVPVGGGMFKTDRLKWAAPPTRWRRVVRGWDKAVTPPSSNRLRGPAYTAGVLVGMDFENRVWVLDVRRERLDSYRREEMIFRTALHDLFLYGPALVVAIEQEPGGGGKESAEATARRLMTRTKRVVLSAASGSKESRADDFSFAVNAGNVHLPSKVRDGNVWVDWAGPFVDEMKHWPFSTFLDQIDAAAHAYKWASKPRTRAGGPALSREERAPEVFRDNAGNVLNSLARPPA